VSELPLDTQAKLLRVLQEREFEPVGSSKTQKVDVRVIAASNRPLDELVGSGGFRIDLLYRLKLMHLQLPPLRERTGDIALLARHFVEIGSARFRCAVRPLADETLDWFDRYTWPGNIRELEHVVYHGLLLGEGPAIVIAPPATLHERPRVGACDESYRRAKEQAIAEFERSYLARVIDQAHGNITAAARLAGAERRHLGRLLKKHRLVKPARQT